MSAFRTIAGEIWSLFVDDKGLAVAAAAWAAFVRLLVAHGRLGAAAGPALFVGLAIILLISVVARAGKAP